MSFETVLGNTEFELVLFGVILAVVTLYDSVVHQGYLSKFCELFCGHSSSSQEFVTVGIACNKEFELVVFGVTFAMVARCSASGHGVSVLSVGDR
jgi:hypothetical protein